ncbi:MAG: hypothetical protein ACKVQS_02660 [Fimbriimonadaceae bacterium]
MKFWARVSISAIGLALAAASFGSLGRFVFAEVPQVPGLEISSTGFRVAHGVADSVYFSSPLTNLRAKRIEDGEAIFQGRDYVFAPGAVRYSPWRPGVEFYFPLSLKFVIRTDLSPYLTWKEGSVGAEVPTAASQWHLLNFRDGQAPLLFIFEEPVQLIVRGDSGNWALQPMTKFKGWVRVLAPVGPKRVASNVAALGELAQKVAPLVDQLTKPMPALVKFEARSDSGFLTAIWSFDTVGAAIPTSLMLSKVGGFETRLLMGVSSSLLDLAEGPIAFSKEPRIAVRFPMRRIGVGQSLAVGKFENGLSSASGFDLPSVVELAFSHFGAGRDALTEDVVSTCASEYRRGLHASIDPVTGRNQLVGADGNGIDLLAAQALLQMSSADVTKDFLKGVQERWDPWSWRIVASDPVVESRATGLFALAGAFSDDPVVRARAAMAEAACAAGSVLGDYAKRRGLPNLSIGSVQPMKQLRESLFGDVTLAPNRADYLSSLSSAVRVVEGNAVEVTREGADYILSWSYREGDRNQISLVTEYPVEVEAKENIASIAPSTFLAETRLNMVAKGPGICRVTLRLPRWVEDLPVMVESPRYSE